MTYIILKLALVSWRNID